MATTTLALWALVAFMVLGFAATEVLKHQLARRLEAEKEQRAARERDAVLEAQAQALRMSLDHQRQIFAEYREHVRQLRDDADHEPWKRGH